MKIADLLALRPERNAAFEACAGEHPAERGRALFGSATLGPVLGLFTLHPGHSLTMATVVYAVGGNYESTHRALHRLVDAGILERHKRGRELLFTPGRDHPLVAPLRAACLQLCTVGPRLRWARDELGTGAIEVASVFGSLATLEEHAESDLDLFVVGSVALPGQHAAGDPEVFHEYVDALCVDQHIAQDQQRPTLAYGLQRAGWRAFLSLVFASEHASPADMEGLVKGGGDGRGRGQRLATMITLISAGRQGRCRMTVSRHRAASD